MAAARSASPLLLVVTAKDEDPTYLRKLSPMRNDDVMGVMLADADCVAVVALATPVLMRLSKSWNMDENRVDSCAAAAAATVGAVAVVVVFVPPPPPPPGTTLRGAPTSSRISSGGK